MYKDILLIVVLFIITFIVIVCVFYRIITVQQEKNHLVQIFNQVALKNPETLEKYSQKGWELLYVNEKYEYFFARVKKNLWYIKKQRNNNYDFGIRADARKIIEIESHIPKKITKEKQSL